MNEEIKQLKNEVEELKRIVKSFYSSTTIPFEVGEAFKKRLENNNLSSSTKSKDSEDVTIDEAGSSTKVVLDDPDGFDKATVNGAVHYYPYYL